MRNAFLLSPAACLLGVCLALAQAPSGLDRPEPAVVRQGNLELAVIPPPSGTAVVAPVGPHAPVPVALPAGSAGDPLNLLWVSGEYVLWWLRSGRLPPLVTTSSPASAGVLGRPDTVILFGGGSTNDSARSGVRVAMG